MPLTPPPRRAPAPHSSTRGCAVSTPQPPGLVAVLGVGPREVAVEDVAGRAGRARPRARAACAPPGTARRRACATGSPRSARRARSRASAASPRRRAPSRRGSREQPRRHVQAEAGQRLRAGRAQLRAEDRRVGERVAVDLARRQRRDLAARRPARRRPASCVADSLTWNVPANASRGSTAASRSRGSRESSMLSLSWAPSGGRLGLRLAEQPGEHGRRDVGEHVPGRRPSRRPSGPRRRGRSRSPRRRSGSPRRPRSAAPGERVGERAHPADRHVPVARRRCRSRGRGSSGSGAATARARPRTSRSARP